MASKTVQRHSYFFAAGVNGNLDGPAKSCKFKQPIGISVEFESIVYICDAQTNSIKPSRFIAKELHTN